MPIHADKKDLVREQVVIWTREGLAKEPPALLSVVLGDLVRRRLAAYFFVHNARPDPERVASDLMSELDGQFDDESWKFLSQLIHKTAKEILSGSPPKTVTRLIWIWKDENWGLDNQEVQAKIFGLLKQELGRIAVSKARIGRRYGYVIEPSDLLNDLYARLLNAEFHLLPENRRRFLGFASTVLRNVVLDELKKARRSKRRADLQVPIDSIEIADTKLSATEFESLYDALDALKEISPSQRELIDLKFYQGFELEDIAAITGDAGRTVRRKLRLAKDTLRKLMTSNELHPT